MSMIQPLGQIKQTRFVDVKPGSKVRYSRPDGTAYPFEASVLEVKQNWGAHSIPAHIFRREGSAEAELMPADGTWIVDILVDSGLLATDVESINTLHAVRIAVEVTAIRFTGGVDSAMESIRFAGGKANLSWRDSSPEGSEAIILSAVDGDKLLEPGSYLVIENDRVVIMSSEDFGNLYAIENDGPGKDEEA